MFPRLSRARSGALALAAAGPLFVLYPTVRPWHDESTLAGAMKSMSSDAWVSAHLFAMLGLILVPLGLLGVHRLLEPTKGDALGWAAAATAWVGAGLTLPYYGAEDFALHAIARSAAAGRGTDLLGLVHDIRFNPVMTTMAAAGLLLLGLGGILTSAAIWRAGTLPRWSGVLFAVGLLLYIPQFYLPEWARIAHGVLLGISSMWLAAAMWSASRRDPAAQPAPIAPNAPGRSSPGRPVPPAPSPAGGRADDTATASAAGG
jgi:hypothetical protein